MDLSHSLVLSLFTTKHIHRSAHRLVVSVSMGGATGECGGTRYPALLLPEPRRRYNEIHIRLQHLEILLPVQFATLMTMKI